MQRQRVLVLYSQSLFAQGLRRLLEKSGDFEVIGVDLDLHDAVTSLQIHQPDALVVDSDDLGADDRFALISLLREKSSLQLVCLIAVDGKISLYRREHTPVNRSEDLLNLLRRGLSDDQVAPI